MLVFIKLTFLTSFNKKGWVEYVTSKSSVMCWNKLFISFYLTSSIGRTAQRNYLLHLLRLQFLASCPKHYVYLSKAEEGASRFQKAEVPISMVVAIPPHYSTNSFQMFNGNRGPNYHTNRIFCWTHGWNMLFLGGTSVVISFAVFLKLLLCHSSGLFSLIPFTYAFILSFISVIWRLDNKRINLFQGRYEFELAASARLASNVRP